MVNEAAFSGLLAKIKGECRGYYYTLRYDELFEFGSDKLRELLPFEYIESIKPFTRVQGLLYHLQPFEWKSKGPLSSRQTERLNSWVKDNEGTLAVYHARLDIDHLAKLRVNYTKNEQDKGSSKPDFMASLKQYFYRPMDYIGDIKQAFSSPSILMGFSPPGNEFLVVGDLKTTSELSNLLLENPAMMPDLISEITGAPISRADEMTRGKKTLVHFDPFKLPRKSKREIKYPANFK